MIAQFKNKNTPIVQELIKAKPDHKSEIIKLYCQIFKVQYVDLDSKDIPFNIINLIPKEIANKSKIIPIDKVANNIIIATENPKDLKIIDSIDLLQDLRQNQS